MSGPARICPLPNSIAAAANDASLEAWLSDERVFCDPEQAHAPGHFARDWQDRQVRTSPDNQELFLVIHSLRQLLRDPSSILSESQFTRLQSWVEASQGESARPLDRTVLLNLQRIFARVAPNASEGFQNVATVLGDPPPAPAPEPEVTAPASEPTSSTGVALRSVAVDLQNDSLLADGILRNIGVPLDAFIIEQSHLTLRVPFEFNLGDYVGFFRPYGGVFSSRGIPGSGVGEIGLGWRAGLDVGVTVPRDPNHQSAGLGLEVTGIAQAAEGGTQPDPVLRLHFHRQRDLANFTLGDARQFEIGVQTFLQTQESYLPLSNQALVEEEARTPFAQSQSIFAINPFRLLGLSLRYYPEGAPEGDNRTDPNRPFAPGEAAPRIASVAVGNIINRNRRRGIPALSNSRVFLGLEPLGAVGSRDQFDTVGLGLTIFSALDGFGFAGTAQDRSEILRRGDWFERGVMLALDGIDLVVSLGLTLAQAGHPDATTIEELRAEPGSLTDFEGRAGEMDLWLRLIEYGLTGLDMTQAIDDEVAPGSLGYGLMGGGAILLGLPLFLFSSPLSGGGCGPEGGLLYCGFGSSDPYFSEVPHEGGPEDMEQVERQFIVSSTGMALTAWGVSRLLGLILGGGGASDSDAETDSAPAGDEAAGQASQTTVSGTPPINFQLQASPQSIHVGVSGTF